MDETDAVPTPERIDLRVLLGDALQTDRLSLEHDTIVVSPELQRRLAQELETAVRSSPGADEHRDGPSPTPR